MQALYYDRDARPVTWQRWRQLTAWIAGVAAFLAGHASRLPAPDPELPALFHPGADQGR